MQNDPSSPSPCYLDCYITQNDPDGFPSATYAAASMEEAIKAKAILGEWFDRVLISPTTNGQSAGDIPENVRRIMASTTKHHQ